MAEANVVVTSSNPTVLVKIKISSFIIIPCNYYTFLALSRTPVEVGTQTCTSVTFLERSC